MDDLRIWLTIAEKAALQAGKYLREAGDKGRQVKLDRLKDIKISADKEAEKIILNFLKEKSNLAILTEESGIVGRRKQKDLFWIVDPLDGSLNFLRKIPVCCVSIALWQGNKPLLGVVYDFNKKEIFSGIVGYGAWLNQRPISVSKVKKKNKAILFTGIATKAKISHRYLNELFFIVRQYKKCRWIGSAALSLAYVAAGRGDVYSEDSIMLWDVAAGLAITVAAGGVYRLKEYKNKTLDIVVSNEYLLI